MTTTGYRGVLDRDLIQSLEAEMSDYYILLTTAYVRSSDKQALSMLDRGKEWVKQLRYIDDLNGDICRDMIQRYMSDWKYSLRLLYRGD